MVAWILQSSFSFSAARWLRKNCYPALFAIFIIGPIVWAAADREPPFMLSDGFTVPAKIKVGGEFQLKWKYRTMRRRCPGTVYFYIVFSNGHINVSPPSAAAFGLIQTMGIDLNGTSISGHKRRIPDDAPIGPALIYSTTDFHCNWTNYVWPLLEDFGPIKTEIVD